MEGQGSGRRRSGVGSASKMPSPGGSVGRGRGGRPSGSGGRGRGRGRPEKLSFSPAASRKLGAGLDIGHTVMVRWSNGLFYEGVVLRVDDANDRCQIRFEDESTFYVLFKDIHKVPSPEETGCCVCKGENNRILVCDSCGMGFHQSCHRPLVVSSGVQSTTKVFCRLCTFAAKVKLGGSTKFSTPVTAKEDVSQILPYKMNILTWDAQHRTNVEQSYCYCGGPGDWYSKMMQCCRCRQWFHEACVQCLQHPLLYGDRFFMFACSMCNQGDEYMKRSPFKWVDIAHLALFNLTLCNTYKYYDLDDVLMPWIAQHQDNLALDSLLDGKSVQSPDVRLKVELALMGHKSKFSSGREVKKKHSLWALINRIPPNAPCVVVPLSGPINSDVLSNPNVKGRKTKQVFPALCQSPIPLKYPSKSSLDQSLSVMFKNTSADTVFPETNNNGLTNGFSSAADTHSKARPNGAHGKAHSNGLAAAPHSKARVNGHSKARLNGDANHHGSKSRPNAHTSSSSGEDEDPLPAPLKKKSNATRHLRHSSEPRKKRRRASSVSADEEEEEEEEKFSKPSAPASTNNKPHRLSSASPADSSSSLEVVVQQRVRSHKPSACVLDRLVPLPPAFEGMDHPFRTEIEKDTERFKNKHFESRVAFLKKEYAGELGALKAAHAAKQFRSSNNNNNNSSATSLEKKLTPAKSLTTNTTANNNNKNGSSSPDPKPTPGRKSTKRKRSVSEEKDDVEGADNIVKRRSGRTRLCAERYQHLLDSFPRHMPKPEPGEGGGAAGQRWKWLSVADQLQYGERFRIQACRTDPTGDVHFLLDWDETDGGEALG